MTGAPIDWRAPMIRMPSLPMTVDLNRLAGHVVVVGYGRVGGRIGSALTANGISFVVIEDNREIVESLRESESRRCSAMPPSPRSWFRRISIARACW